MSSRLRKLWKDDDMPRALLEAWAQHEAFRRLGFSPDDIFFGANQPKQMGLTAISEAPAGSPHLRHRRAVLANRLRAQDPREAICGDLRVVPEADEPRADPLALGELRRAVQCGEDRRLVPSARLGALAGAARCGPSD